MPRPSRRLPGRHRSLAGEAAEHVERALRPRAAALARSAAPRGRTAAAVAATVDAAAGITTGISASDRTRTLRVLADPGSTTSSPIRPGHILTLKAAPGGVRERAGHTEAAVELMQLAGLEPVAVIGEVVGDDGELLRLPHLLEMGER